ncbi:MAG: ATP synthase A1 subunit C, partial [Candidatus Methanomethylophilaceae archaeon]
LGETVYQKEMAELAGRIEGVDLIEHATYRNMARSFRSILDMSTGDLHEMIAANLTRWDYWNLKVILRAKTFGADVESIREDLVPAGKEAEAFWNMLVNLETVDDILVAFSKEEGVEFPPQMVEALKTEGRLTALEDFLDKTYYQRLLDSIDPSSKPTRLFKDFIKMEIDIINVETILKLRMENVPADAIMPFIIDGGKQLDMKLAGQLAAAENLEAMAPYLKKLDFYGDIAEVLKNDTSSLRMLVSALEKYKIRKTKTFSHLYPLSVIPILDYMINKQVEVDNLRIIARGKVSGLDNNTIKELLVI